MAEDVKAVAWMCNGHVYFLESNAKDYSLDTGMPVFPVVEQQAIDALRAEVALLRVGAENERLHQRGLLDRERERAERLAEALRLYMSAGFGNSTDFYKQAEAKRAATEALHPTAAQEGE